MNEFKGTPAPWATRANSGAIDVFHLYSDGSGSGSPHAKIYDSFFRMEKMRADASLISAAPDLLEALIAMVKEYGQLGAEDLDYSDEVLAARAAIAKALGDSK